MAEALYEHDGDTVVPSDLTRGPWDPNAQHGGPVAALLAHAIERVGDGDGLGVARITFEFVRPAPLAPLTVAAEVVRPGRRVQLAEGRVEADGEVVCRARALRIRREPGEAEDVEPPSADPPVPPDDLPASPGPSAHRPMFGGDGMELRFANGAFRERGPAVAWLRLMAPLFAGEEPSPVVRAVAAADFGNGISAALGWDRHVFINPDLTVYLDRDPVGEWICLDAQTTVRDHGVGLAESVLRDSDGRFGRGLQALYVAAR